LHPSSALFPQVCTVAASTAGISPDLKIVFYAGRYDSLLLGIFPVGNPMDCIAATTTDVVILEEPEHLAWFHCHNQWTSKFKHVVRPFPPPTDRQLMLCGEPLDP